MTDFVDSAVRPTVTTGPIQGSSKVYRDVAGARLPFRRVHLTNSEYLDLYDTSGPYTDADAVIAILKENGEPSVATLGRMKPRAAGAERLTPAELSCYAYLRPLLLYRSLALGESLTSLMADHPHSRNVDLYM